MRKWMTLLLLLGFAAPAISAKTLSIEQTEQLFVKLRTKPDAKAAAALSNVELSERVSRSRLAQWEAEFPGSRTREQLMRLADESAFLNPPISDALPDPRPDIKTQEQMLRMAVQYVENTMSRLPDFYATRQTTHFEDTLSQQTGRSVENTPTGQDEHEALSAIALGAPTVVVTTVFKALHSTGEFSTTVTYRGGHEVAYTGAVKQKTEPSLGLTTSGEFGPILAQVLSDALESNIGWLRWTIGPNGPAGVFNFDVPAKRSHFRVNITSGGQAATIEPAYHGEIEIDPATGAILRLSEIADMTPPNQAIRAAIAVEYTPVTIGGRTFICPTHGVAYSKIPFPTAGTADKSAWPVQTELNDVAFTHYHEFGSETRILTGADAASVAGSSSGTQAAAPEVAASAKPRGANSTASIAPATPPQATPEPAANTPASASSTAPSASTPANPAPATSAIPAPSSASVSQTSQVKTAEAIVPSPASAAAASSAPATPGPVFHTQSRLVLVDVAVTHHDRPITGLDRGRFHIFEDGKPVAIASFEEHKPEQGVTIAPPPPLPPDTWSNAPAYPETGAVNVLLLDALNTPANDQERVRRAMIDYLGSIKSGTPMAVFTLASQLRMAAGFTTDSARLLKLLESKKGKPGSAAGLDSGNLSTTLEQTASSINTSSDPGTMWLISQIQQFAKDTGVHDTDQRATITIAAMSELARYLAAIPGRKNLIWFSESFPIGIGANAGVRTPLKDVRDYSGAVKQMSALLAAARVAIYPVDAQGVTMRPTSNATYIPPPASPQPGESWAGRPGTAIDRDNKSANDEAMLDENTMDAIAAQTGGHVYSAGNDLKADIDKIMANDAYYYTLSYIPPEAKEGKSGTEFHRIEVKVDGGRYQLAYRRGYSTEDVEGQTAAKGGLPKPVGEALEFGAPPSTQIVFEARVRPQSDSSADASPSDGTPGAEPNDKAGAMQLYNVELRVQPRGVVFTEGARGERHAHLECALAAYDAQGRIVNSLLRAFDLDTTAAHYTQLTASGGAIPVRLPFAVPAHTAVLRIAVYDPASAKTGSLEIPAPAENSDGEN